MTERLTQSRGWKEKDPTAGAGSCLLWGLFCFPETSQAEREEVSGWEKFSWTFLETLGLKIEPIETGEEHTNLFNISFM